MVVDDNLGLASPKVHVNGAAHRAKALSLGIERVPVMDASNQPLVDDHVFLTGRPSLRSYLSFVGDLAIEGQKPNARTLTEQWRQAHEVVRQRELDEPDWADDPTITPLPASMEALREQCMADPIYQRAFDDVPTEIAIVELDRMVVYQKHINVEFTKRLRARLGDQPTDEEIFKFCLPFDHPKPPFKTMRTNSYTQIFISPSNDIRYLGAMMLKPENLVGVPSSGNLIGVIGLAVGFGSNFLNAIHVDGRVVLNNGSHRAYTLRSLGITHVPCIVQHCASREEMLTVASSDLRRHPERYLGRPRPSVLKDYFDPELHKVIPCVRRLRQVKVKFSSDESDLPAI